LKGTTGWARVRFESLASIDGERISVKRHRERHLWELRRRESGWLVFTPLERLYVPRNVAVRVFAEQLASLTRDDSAARKSDKLVRQQMELARLLNALLGKE
jgi:hypothetical protein